MIESALKFFKQYEAVVSAAESAFERVKKEYPDSVKCTVRCSDCCYALFDLTLIEAMYINNKFNERYNETQRESLLEKANRVDRRLAKLKKSAQKDLNNGKSEEQIIAELSCKRIRCPLLNEQDLCDLYENRPITCRVYGIPNSFAGEAHTCGLSGFVKGDKYPSVNLDIIQGQLSRISEEFVSSIGSRYSKLGELLVPLSMVLLTDYDEEYLGIVQEKRE